MLYILKMKIKVRPAFYTLHSSLTYKKFQIWNDYLKEEKIKGEGISWFSASWMWAECYLYRYEEEFED